MNLNKLFTALRQRKNTPAHIQRAERRERYTHALEQFLDGHQPAVRLSGAYTLTNLADEWLADTALPEQVRREEAQTIIDALTGCIRTPYPLAQKRQVLETDEAPEEYEGDFTRDQEALREEQLVRRTVFMEFSRRLATVAESTEKDSRESQRTVPPISPMWADLRFDFGGAPIFYPLRQLHFQNADFASATFYGPADFSGATFHGDTSFSAAQFTADASFHGANFTDWVGFSAAHFAGAANFTDWVGFSAAHFAGAADFSGASFTQFADFGEARFDGDASFSRSSFFAVIRTSYDMDFPQYANFANAAFAQDADFSKTTFTAFVGFGRVTFAGAVNFNGASFEGAYFKDATFGQRADFRQTSFMYVKPSFEDLEERLQTARFSAQADPQDYLFGTRSESPHGFSCGTATLLNRTFVLPLGTVLYDPDSWDEEKQDYTRFSEPAQ